MENDPPNDQRRRNAAALKEVVDECIDWFSRETLDYNRKAPRDGQRTPGDVLREIEERMRARDRRTEAIQKWLGAVLVSLTVAGATAFLTTVWPLFGKH